MSWFKRGHELEEAIEAMFQDEESENPFVNQVFEEKFVRIPIPLRTGKFPIWKGEAINGSSSKPADVSS